MIDTGKILFMWSCNDGLDCWRTRREGNGMANGGAEQARCSDDRRKASIFVSVSFVKTLEDRKRNKVSSIQPASCQIVIDRTIS